MSLTGTITMPHRHTVRYVEPGCTVDYEVELVEGGIVFYRAEPVEVTAETAPGPEMLAQIAGMMDAWLRRKFTNVESDFS